MKEPPFLADCRVAVLGLGLMGGSLALALRGKCAALLGIDPDPAVLSLALERAVVNEASADPADLLPQADLVILAAPVSAILALIQELPELHPGRAVVIDLGSTKVEISAALAKLPERFDPLGGHPMCGKEQSSLAHAEAGLFRGAPFAFTPLERTSRRARSLAQQMAEAAGAHPVWLDASTHDEWTAATSHLPYLVSSALALATPVEASPLVGPGFRSATRLAAASAAMMSDVLLTNRGQTLAALERFKERLDQLTSFLLEQDTALQGLLAEGAEHRRQIIGDGPWT